MFTQYNVVLECALWAVDRLRDYLESIKCFHFQCSAEDSPQFNFLALLQNLNLDNVQK